MAKKRKVARRRTVKRAKRAKPAARRRSAKSGMSPDETMNMIVALLVVVLIGLGIYFYQTNQKPAKTGMIAPAAVVDLV